MAEALKTTESQSTAKQRDEIRQRLTRSVVENKLSLMTEDMITESFKCISHGNVNHRAEPINSFPEQIDAMIEGSKYVRASAIYNNLFVIER